MVYKGRPARYSKKDVVSRATSDRVQSDAGNRFENLKDWETYDPNDDPALAQSPNQDERPHRAFSKDREAPGWIAPDADATSGSDTNFETNDEGESPSTRDGKEDQAHEKFVKVLHSAWASATSHSNTLTEHRAFDADHPQTLEERLNSLREAKPSHEENEHASERPPFSERANSAPRRRTSEGIDDVTPADRTAMPQSSGKKPTSPHNGTRNHAFSEAGLPRIIDQLRPDVIGIHPDDRVMPAPKQKRTIHWSGQALAITALAGIGLGAFLLYQNIWLTDSNTGSNWHIAPAFTTPKAQSKPVIAAANIAQGVKTVGQPEGLNHTPPPVTPGIEPGKKAQERLATPAPVARVTPTPEAPLPAAPSLQANKMATPIEPAVVPPSPTPVVAAPLVLVQPKASVSVAAKTPATNIQKQQPLPARSEIAKSAAPMTLPAPPVMVITPASEPPRQRHVPRDSEQTKAQQPQRIARLDPESLTSSPKPANTGLKPAPAQRSQKPLSEMGKIVTQADQHIVLGDISAARLLYEYAAQAGNVDAAVKLAQTFDPVAFKTMDVQGVKPDPELARKWYQFASKRGSSVATLRLQALKVWLSQIDQFKN